MIIILLIVIAGLLGIVIYQYQSNKSRSAGLRMIQGKLQRIISDETDEKLLLVTDDRELRALLLEINLLLEYTRKTAANFTRMELSTKKMISNISHDLKTPLTVILGYIETIHMNTEMDSQERADLLAKVYKKTLEVLTLIHKFFDLAKLEAGDEHFPVERVHLNEICRQNILGFYEILTAKGFDVHIEIPDDDIFILGNAEALNRILNNLISNAIQHGGDGKTIGIKLAGTDSSAAIEVWDRGKGIREQHRDRIFERLFTLEDSRNKAYHNSGLGLTITKRLVERMDGTITLSSHPYERTAFSIRFNRIRY